MSTFMRKAQISLMIAGIFFVVNLPMVYRLVNNLFKDIVTFNDSTGCPTMDGLLVHTLVFSILVFIKMFIPKDNKKESISLMTKVKHTLYSALIFYFLSSPAVYKISNNLLNNFNIADNQGCQTMVGAGIHAIAYFVVLILVMYLPDYCPKTKTRIIN